MFYALLLQNGIFERKYANNLGKSIAMDERTVGNYLTELKSGGFIKGANGKYEKVQQQ